jgi:hypothetical protein
MTYRGQVKNGVIVLENNPLPEGTVVDVQPVADDPEMQRLRDDLLKLAGTVEGYPSDMAKNHDHYIRGADRK